MGRTRASVGVSIPKLEAPDKVTGRAVYVEDVRVPGLLHGATVRSTIPRGRIKSVELDIETCKLGVQVLYDTCVTRCQ